MCCSWLFIVIYKVCFITWQNMDIRVSRSWMYNRLMPGRKDYTREFEVGLGEFISYTIQQPGTSNGKIRCPCSKCKNLDHLYPDEVIVHLHKKGFKPGYWYWTCHGETNPNLCVKSNTHHRTTTSTQERQGEHLLLLHHLEHLRLHPFQVHLM